MTLGTHVPTGILLPESLLHSDWVQVPAIFGRRNRRMQNRRIHPGRPNAGS